MLGLSSRKGGTNAAAFAAAAGYRGAFDLADTFDGNTMRQEVQAGTFTGDIVPFFAEALAYAPAHDMQIITVPHGKMIAKTTGTGTFKPLIPLKSNLAIVGTGRGSLLKLDDGFSVSQGNHCWFGINNTGTTINNLLISGLRVDGTVATNPVIDSAGNLRTLYLCKFESGDNIEICNMTYENAACRNAFNMGHNAATPDLTNIRVHDIRLYNVGPVAQQGLVYNAVTYTGNEQNDCSLFYAQFAYGTIYNITAVNPLLPDVALTEVLFEIHGQRTIVQNFRGKNLTAGINSVAQVHDSIDNQFINGTLLQIGEEGIAFNSLGGFVNRRTVFRDIHIEMAAANGSPSGGVYSGRTTADCTVPEDAVFERVYVRGDTASSLAQTWSGFDLVTGKNIRLRECHAQDIQASGFLFGYSGSIVESGWDGENRMDDCVVDRCGLHVANTEVWAWHVKNAGTIVTMTLASPCVVSWAAHPFVAGSEVSFTTTGGLPTGVTSGQTYFVLATGLTANSFQFAASPGGAAINSSVSQSGVHTGVAEGRITKGIRNRRFTARQDPMSGTQMRGVKLEGLGRLINVTMDSDWIIEGIPRTVQYATALTTNFSNVFREKKVQQFSGSAGDPSRGVAEAGTVWSQRLDVTATSVALKEVLTSGSYFEATTWAASTRYKRGQVVKSLTGNNVLEALNGGLSGTPEPSWTATIYGTTADSGGSPAAQITWRTLDTTIAVSRSAANLA